MPSRKTKEDTWKEDELLDAIQGSDRRKKSSSSRTSKSGESSRHRSKEDKKDKDSDKDKEKHRRSEAGGGHKKDSDREGRERRKERSDGKVKEMSREDEEKYKRRHKEEDREKRKEDKEKSSRKKQEKQRTESEDDRAKRKERERKEEKHRERRKDKDSRRENEKYDEGSKEKEKRRKHSSDDSDRRKAREHESRTEEEPSAKEERRKHRSSKKDRKDRDKPVYNEEDERGNKESSSKSRSRDKNDRHKGKGREDDVERNERKPFKLKDAGKQDSFQHHDEEIEETIAKRPTVSIRKSSILNTEEVQEEEIDVNDYEYDDEDFEDYDDDFEDDDGDEDGDGANEAKIDDFEGVDEIRKAILEENQLAGSLNSSTSSSRPSTRDDKGGRMPASNPSNSLKSQPRGKINFVAAKQKQISEKVSNRTKQRGKELSKLIELDVVGMDIFELRPLNIYEVYMKSFGRMNTEQSAVQTNEDTLDQEIQTDEIETETKWSQFSNEVQSYGGGEKASNATNAEKFILKQDTRRLNKFLSKATHLCMTLLNEVRTEQDRMQKKYAESNRKFSDGLTKLDFNNEFVNGREIIDSDVSQSDLMLLAYGRCQQEQRETISSEGVACIWNLSSSSEPQMYLSCGSTPKCCCFSSRKPTFAFAGMEDGSVSVWDLREPVSMHARRKSGKKEVALRSETFSTASVYGDDAHSSSVVSIAAITSPSDASDSYATDSPTSSALDKGGYGALQLVSLEESGTLHIWVVIEVFSPDPGGSQQDLGLMPGGRIKLVKSGTITPQTRFAPANNGKFFNTKILHVEPNRCKSLYIGTDQGIMLHTSRFGDNVSPKYFGAIESDTAKFVSSISHCPWELPYILTGYTDGTLSLFSSQQGYPLTTWHMFSRGASISKVQWSQMQAGVFFTLDAECCFSIWDLLVSETGPVMQELMKTNASRALDFFVTENSSEIKRRLVILYDDNTIEIHVLKKIFSDSSPRKIDDVCARLGEIS